MSDTTKGVLQAFLNFAVTQGYGSTDYAAEPAGHGVAHWHNGIDFAAPNGTPITPFKNGTITAVGFDPSGYGQYVKVKYDDEVEALFGHLQKDSVRSQFQGKLQVGSSVQAYEPIALTGSTGNSSGPHVHFALFKDGSDIDPGEWLKQFSGNLVPPPTAASPIVGDPNILIGNAGKEDVTQAVGIASGLVPGWLQHPNWWKVGIAVVAVLFVFVGLFGAVLGSDTGRTVAKAAVA